MPSFGGQVAQNSGLLRRNGRSRGDRPFRKFASKDAGCGFNLVASAPTSTRSSPAFRTLRDCVVGCGSKWIRACRYNPQLDCQISTATAVYSGDTGGLDSARINQVVLGAVGSSLTLTFTCAIGDDVALRSGLVLQLNCVVVETSLLVIEPDVTIFVELRRVDHFFNHDRSGARSSSRTFRCNAA